jgi:DNA-binding MarR family transcriptional regulator
MSRAELMHFLLDVFEYKRYYQAESSGLRPVDLFLLERIAKHDGCQTLELARACHFPPATLISMLDRLESADLVARRRSKEDRRMVHVYIKPNGFEVLKTHQSEDHAFVNNLFGVLNPQEQAQLEQILTKMSQSVVYEKLFQNASD